MADNDKRTPTKPYYIADRQPGFNVRRQAPPSVGFNLPTPAGWLPAGELGSAVADFAGNLVPSRQGLAQTLGAPMDGMAWIARQFGAKGIPGGYADADPITQALNGKPQVWQPSADVPLSSANLQRMMDNPPDLAALLRHALSRPGRF